MTQTEIKAKIADWESRLKNPSVASVPSAVAKINSIIDDLKSKLEAEKPKEKAPKKEKKAKADKKEFEPKFKVGDYVSMFKDEPNLEVVKVYEFSDKKATYDLKSKDGKIDRGNISETKLTKAEEKSEPKESKKESYDCDDLIKEAKERHAKAKKAAEARAEAPKKTEATKDKEKIEKVYDNVEKHIEKNKLSKAQLEKLIAETKDLLKLLEKALKNL
jgi:hypothetical protein